MNAPFRLLAAVWLALALSFTAQAQGVGIGTSGPPAASAALEVNSTTGGLLLPRLTAGQRAAVPSPTDGLLVFQTDGTPGLYYYIGGAWVNVTNGVVPDANGNAGASPLVRVSTLAGNGTTGLVDGTGPAAQFYKPLGLALEGTVNLYVADNQNNCIRKIVIATGVVTTLAGNSAGYPAYIDGTGTSAWFAGPSGVALSSGILYVADKGNQAIRKIVIATGVVTTLAGARNYSTNGVDFTATPGFADGTGAAASFRDPNGVTCDTNGNLYVADEGNRAIRKIVIATGVVTTLAGNGTVGFVDGTAAAARFSNVTSVASDGYNTLYVADPQNQRIRKIDVNAGVTARMVTTLAGNGGTGLVDGTGPGAQFSYPSGVACDPRGNVYVADEGNHAIRKIVPATGVVTTLAGNGAAGFADGTGQVARFNSPTGVACGIDSKVYVVDQNNQRIRVVR